MAKQKNIFVCQSCGYISYKWMGKCPECNEWNTFIEELEQPKKAVGVSSYSNGKIEKILEIEADKEERMLTAIQEFDTVLGGGLVKGSLVLVGGDPGIGKSTLLLQMASNLSAKGKKVLYVSGEESKYQLKMRAKRLEVAGDGIYVLSETAFERVEQEVKDLKPDILIVDSIQTMSISEISSAPGSVTQVREVTSKMMGIAKGMGISSFIVGHVTKAGSIAGPKILEHMVDTVLYFEGEKSSMHRILRSVKNRFGSTNEVGLFEMTSFGLEEIKNPSEIFMSSQDLQEAGSVVFPSIEGSRPLLVELQSLVTTSSFSSPRRMGMGVEYNKLIMLAAVLEKKLSMQLQGEDIYVNVIGGIQITEPAADLAVAACIASSFLNQEIDQSTVVMGEIGLQGELRSVPQLEKRLLEAKKMGFKQVILPKRQEVKDKDLTIHPVRTVEEAFQILFKR